MPMPINGKFIEKYGKAWETMDEGEKQMAIMSELFDLRESVEPVKEICGVVEKHKTYFRGIWVAITAIGIPTLLMIIGWAMELIKRGLMGK